MTQKYCYDFPRPAVTVDLVLFTRDDAGAPRVLVIRRKHAPFAGRLAFPGGFVEIDEPLEAAARRELEEETGVAVGAGTPIHFLGVWGAPGRDPRGRTISAVYGVELDGPPPLACGADDAEDAAWLDPRSLSGMAFDHDDILSHALRWLAGENPPPHPG